jgi:hypothetical protein
MIREQETGEDEKAVSIGDPFGHQRIFRAAFEHRQVKGTSVEFVIRRVVALFGLIGHDPVVAYFLAGSL